MITHPSTNWAQYRVTSFMRKWHYHYAQPVKVKSALLWLKCRHDACLHLPRLRPLRFVMHGKCHASPMVMFPAAKYHRQLTGNKLYSLMTGSQEREPMTSWSQVRCPTCCTSCLWRSISIVHKCLQCYDTVGWVAESSDSNAATTLGIFSFLPGVQRAMHTPPANSDKAQPSNVLVHSVPTLCVTIKWVISMIINGDIDVEDSSL